MGLFNWGKSKKEESKPIQTSKQNESGDLEITPQMALAKLNEAKESGIFLGSEYPLYANIAGQPYENEMLNELVVLDASKIYEWENKQKVDGKYLTNKVFAKANELKDAARKKTEGMYDAQQKAIAAEAEGNIEKAIELFEEVCEKYNYPLYSVDRLTILYRKTNQLQSEIDLCERYLGLNNDDFSDKANSIRKRFTKAKLLLSKNS